MTECYSANIVNVGNFNITTNSTKIEKKCLLSKPTEIITLRFSVSSNYSSYNHYDHHDDYNYRDGRKFVSFNKLELIFNNYVHEVHADSSQKYAYTVDVRALIEKDQVETHVNFSKVLHAIRIDKVLKFNVQDQQFDILQSCKIKHFCFKMNRLVVNEDTLNDMFQVHHISNSLSFKNTSCISLVVGSDKFAVHKELLSLQSDVFAAMFKHEVQENTKKIIKIEDFEADVIEEMIRFMYTNEISDTIEHPEDLYAVAHKYQMEDLKVKCIEYLIFNLNFSTATSLYILAKLYNIDRLITTLNSFFKKYDENMVEEETYRSYLCENINSENLKDILFLCAKFNESLGNVKKTAFTFIKNNMSEVIDQLILVDWFEKHGTLAYELFKFINYQDSQD